MNDLIYRVKGICIKVHEALGPGLYESVYQTILAYELRKSGFKVDTEVRIPVIYENIKFDCGFRADMIVNDSLIIELKAIDKILPVHHIQLRTYLKLSGLKAGLLVNFNTTILHKDGIHTWRAIQRH